MLLCVTASHKTASFELLERLSRHPETVAPSLMAAGVQGAVVLATCNRFEAYVEADEVDSEAVIETVAQATGIPSADLDRP